MTPYGSSSIAAAQAVALEKGPSFGSSGVQAQRALYLLEASVSLAVGSWLSTTSARLGILPKGARVLLRPTELSSSHTADIAGKIVFTPVSGNTATQELTGVSCETNTTPAASIPPTTAATVTLLEDCWVDFVPTADTVIAATPKTLWGRIVYSLGYH